MCLAIFKPANVTVPKDRLASGWQCNPDGAGFSYVHKGKIVIKKGLMSLKTFLTEYEEASKKYPESPFLIHFRIRTHGFKDEHNTHPFLLENGGAMIHNGSMDGTGAVYGTGQSDTALFVEKFGKNLSYSVVSENKEALETAIEGNKLVFMYPNKQCIILNERFGTWDDDVWYSNGSYTYKTNRE